MIDNVRGKQFILAALAGLTVGLLSLLFTVQFVSASSQLQTEDEPPPVELYTAKECQECHLDVTNHWSSSAHAHAYDDPVFQTRWVGMGEPGECLTCHTTGYSPSTGEFDIEGISCQSCHGAVAKDHPDAVVPILADTEYCGTCHTTTLGEWHLTGHASSEIGCTDCHDPHSQDPLFEVADDMCLNCHEESMGDYLEDTHHSKDIGCVDCHALVIPPEVPPEDGIVPTGHAFTITPATCVACHTDSLHAGFSLPGYENGATAAVNGDAETIEVLDETGAASEEVSEEADVEEEFTPEQRVQALEAAIASQNVTLLFQGGVVGLVLGGSTAWIVATNVRRGKKETDDDEEGA
jgi:hypothetical protein